MLNFFLMKFYERSKSKAHKLYRLYKNTNRQKYYNKSQKLFARCEFINNFIKRPIVKKTYIENKIDNSKSILSNNRFENINK